MLQTSLPGAIIVNDKANRIMMSVVRVSNQLRVASGLREQRLASGDGPRAVRAGPAGGGAAAAARRAALAGRAARARRAPAAAPAGRLPARVHAGAPGP